MGKSKEGIGATCENKIKLTLCEIFIEDIQVGNHPTTHFNKEGCLRIIKKNKKYTRREYDRSQLKNKWDGLGVEARSHYTWV